MVAQPSMLLAACFFFFFVFVMSHHSAAAVSFSYDFSEKGVLDSAGLNYTGNANSSASGDRIVLTNSSIWSTGLVAYPHPVRLWDQRTGKAASFSTSFSFAINPIGTNNISSQGDGMAFFVRPFPAESLSLPLNSRGAFLGLFSDPSQPESSPPAVGVEFDTYWNKEYDPADIPDRDHIGIDVKEIKSVNYTAGALSGTMSANVTYDATSKLLVVTLRLADGSTHAVQAGVDFKDAGLPEDAAVGFSATTGGQIESNELLSWSFSSTDPSNKIQLWVIILLSVASAFLAASVAALLWGIIHRQRGRPDIPSIPPLPVARKFTFRELSAATNNFSDDMRLGAGQFGEVYKGELSDPLIMPLLVAVKKLKMPKEERERNQIRRDYVIEITTLGRLSHRNLVRLVGWCHGGGADKQELLLVYELVTNRSLDEHLHESERLLTWPERYRIVCDIGAAIENLHTSYQNPILHRDIKPSNVMLENDFVAKLGDFGLVRQIMDPVKGSLGGTKMAGDMAYFDPVCISKNTVSVESDVYSFGVLLVEIATGKRPIVMQGADGLLSNTLVNAVRESFARGDDILQMADSRLNGDFDEGQMERVLVVGRLCVQHRREDRPKIRNAVNLLSDLKYPVPQSLS